VLLPPRAIIITQETYLPRSLLPLLRNNAPVILVKPHLRTPVNCSAFAYNKKGQKRSDAAARKAQYRASQGIVQAITKLDKNQRSLAIRDALSNPQVREAASVVAFDLSSVANMQLNMQLEQT
jgi:hypothetical protein